VRVLPRADRCSLHGGNVGIGTSSPGSKFQVNGNVSIGYSTATAGPANGLAVSGNVGIGTTSPSVMLDVAGKIAASGGTVMVSAAQVKNVTARITNSGTCVIASQDGNWLSSVSRPTVGKCVLNISNGIFSAAPRCTCSLESGAIFGVCQLHTAPTTNDVQVIIGNIANGAWTDGNFHISCTGTP